MVVLSLKEEEEFAGEKNEGQRDGEMEYFLLVLFIEGF